MKRLIRSKLLRRRVHNSFFFLNGPQKLLSLPGSLHPLLIVDAVELLCFSCVNGIIRRIWAWSNC